MGDKLAVKISKSNGANKINGKEVHNLRLGKDKRENEHLNSYYGAVEGRGALLKAVDKFVDKKNKELKENGYRKIRKDANKVFELIVTSGSDFFKNHDDEKFYSDVDEFLRGKFSDDCIAAKYIHRDEKTSHAHYMVYPIVSLDKGGINFNYHLGKDWQWSKFQQEIYDYMTQEKGYQFDERTLKQDSKKIYKDNIDWSKNVDKAREEVNLMDEQERFDYAIKGVVLEEKNQLLQERVHELREELTEAELYKDKYSDLYNGASELWGKDYVDNIEYDGWKERIKNEKNNVLDIENEFENELEL